MIELDTTQPTPNHETENAREMRIAQELNTRLYAENAEQYAENVMLKRMLKHMEAEATAPLAQ